MLMDIVEMPFMRFPGMPVVARVYAILAKYAALGVAPIAVPPIVFDVPIVTEKIPTAEGHRPRDTSARWPVMPGTSSTWSPARSRAPTSPTSAPTSGPHPAARPSVAWQPFERRIAQLQPRRPGQEGPRPERTSTPSPTRSRSPSRSPNISLLHPPLGCGSTPPSKVQFSDDTAGSAAEALKCARATCCTTPIRDRHRDARRRRATARLRSKMVVGGPGCRPRLRRHVLRQQRDPQLKRGEYKQTFSISRDGLIISNAGRPVWVRGVPS